VTPRSSRPTELLFSREHGNRYVSEVHVQADGRYTARMRRASALTPIGDEIADLESIHLAQSVADALAHPGCSCLRCGRWVSLAGLYRAA
jgi:hypothetical protein